MVCLCLDVKINDSLLQGSDVERWGRGQALESGLVSDPGSCADQLDNCGQGCLKSQFLFPDLLRRKIIFIS